MPCEAAEASGSYAVVPQSTVITAPAPAPGTHQFKLVDEHGDGFTLLVDGVDRLGFGFPSGYFLSRIEVGFTGTEGTPFSPLSVGLVRLVPSPTTVLGLGGGLGMVAAGRRRR